MIGAFNLDERHDALREVIELHEAMSSPVPAQPIELDDDGKLHRTLAEIEPFLPDLGITRVGDVTDLDTIGIPVWFACRPNARSLSVSQGKGLHESQARTSAVMESIEHAIAERPQRIVTRLGSVRSMRETGVVTVPFERMARCRLDRIDCNRERAWGCGVSLRTGETLFAPYEMLGLDLRAGLGWDHAAFKMSSIGLAAGSTTGEAVLHGLLEVCEHAATATLEVFGMLPALTRRLRYSAGAHPRLDEAVARVRHAGLEPAFIDLTSARGPATIGAFLDRSVLGNRGAGESRPCAGFACRLDPSEAALAALLEAVQSRLTDIAGSRDDIAPEDYQGSTVRLPGVGQRTVEIASLRNLQPGGGNAAVSLRRLLDEICAVDAIDVCVFPFDSGDMNVRVVRVIVSGLDAPDPGGVTSIGIDALERLLARTSP